MKLKKYLVFAVTALANFCVFAAPLSPVGYWQTIDDRTHQPRALVKLYEQNGNVQGKIVRTVIDPGDPPYCQHCPGSLKNQPFSGLPFLWGMKQKSTLEWSGGQIMDPKTGTFYRCNMTLSNNGQKLKVRGYIGIPLLGRTQIWYRK